MAALSSPYLHKFKWLLALTHPHYWNMAWIWLISFWLSCHNRPQAQYFDTSPRTFGSVYYLSTQFLPKVVYILKVWPFLFPPLAPLQCWHLCGNHKQRPELSCSCDVCGHQIGGRSLTARHGANNRAKIAIMTLCWEQKTRGQCLQQRSVTGGEC